jgi:hypothetical protein
MDIHSVLKNLRDISSRFAAERTERQQRRALVTADFTELRDAGFLLTGVPVEEGGVWQDLPIRHVPFAKRCEFWRTGILPLRLFVRCTRRSSLYG